MESIPEQRIEALPGATRQEIYLKIETVCELRRRRATQKYSEDDIAQRAGFGSVGAMYHQLKRWGLTGLLPPEKQEEAPKPKAEKPDRKARSSGAPEVVPDASAATKLFNEAIDELRESAKLLENLSLVYHGKRFAGTYSFEGSWIFPRGSLSEQRWQELWEQYGHDPDVERFPISYSKKRRKKLRKQYGRDPEVESLAFKDASSKHSTEAGPYPPREVATLIAAYALAGRPIESLLEVLYPEYSQADVEKINKLLYETQSQGSKDGLLRTAQQLAAAVYGRKVGQGAPFEIPPEKVQLACHITERREAGATDEEIHEAILDSGRRLSKEDFAWLADLGYRFPNS